MGCTSSNQTAVAKDNTRPVPTTSHDGQQLIPDHFRKWLKTNRPKADEFVLNDVLSTAPPSNEAEDYRNIVGKALDLLADRHDIKSTNKLGKLLQKEISLASPKKVAHTVQILKQTADKLRDGQIQLEPEGVAAVETTDEAAGATATDQATTAEATAADSKTTKVLSGEPGIPLRDALDKARVLFYKGKQAAIFANPNGGYDVRIVDENDETIHHDGNLLRSIIVTEVKMRPKTTTTITTTSHTPQFVPPPPPSTAPPPIGSTLLDENEITDDFRRSIDAALKGLEAVYQTSSPSSVSGQQQRQPIHVETVKTTRTSSPPPPKVIQYGVTNAPLPRSISKERTTVNNEVVAPIVVDSTANLAEIIHQMAEQQKLVAERLAKETLAENEPLLIETDIQPKLVALVDSMSDLMMDSIEITTESQIGNPVPPLTTETIEKLVNVTAKDESEGEIQRIVREIKEHGEKFESKESLPSITTSAKQPSSYSIGLTSPLSNESLMTASIASASAVAPSVTTKSKLRGDNRPKSFIATEENSMKDRYNLNKQISLDELAHLTQTGLSNPHLPTSTTKLGISTSSGKIEEEEQMPIVTSDPLTNMATSISQIIEEHHPILDELSSSSPPTAATAPVVTPVETQPHVKSPTHNVTYTEIIHSESRDGEQSRRFVTESYNEHPSNEDEQTTTLKVVTKSEFTNHPTTGEKIMEQSVQVITVKVRNETIKTTVQHASIPASSSDNEANYERRPVSELVKNFEYAATGTNINNGN